MNTQLLFLSLCHSLFVFVLSFQLSRQVSSTRAAITEAMNAEKGYESQRMFAEMVFHETSKMDEEVWSAYYVEATQQLHRFRSLQIQRNREQQTQQPPAQPFQPPAQPLQPPPRPFQPAAQPSSLLHSHSSVIHNPSRMHKVFSSRITVIRHRASHSRASSLLRHSPVRPQATSTARHRTSRRRASSLHGRIRRP